MIIFPSNSHICNLKYKHMHCPYMIVTLMYTSSNDHHFVCHKNFTNFMYINNFIFSNYLILNNLDTTYLLTTFKIINYLPKIIDS
jgi:hypothetical protein